MDLREALDSIATIRRRMAETEVFRGYRSIPVAASARLAVIAGAIQPLLIPQPDRDVRAFLLLWSTVAALSIGAALLTMRVRDRMSGIPLTRSLTWLAISQFIPCLLCGMAVTAILVRLAPEACWLLPGLWQLFFSLGVFATCRVLPRSAYLVSAFYFVSGIVTLVYGRGDEALAPWTMAIPFGCGQILSACVLYFSLERRYAGEKELVQ